MTKVQISEVFVEGEKIFASNLCDSIISIVLYFHQIAQLINSSVKFCLHYAQKTHSLEIILDISRDNVTRYRCLFHNVIQ